MAIFNLDIATVGINGERGEDISWVRYDATKTGVVRVGGKDHSAAVVEIAQGMLETFKACCDQRATTAVCCDIMQENPAGPDLYHGRLIYDNENGCMMLETSDGTSHVACDN